MIKRIFPIFMLVAIPLVIVLTVTSLSGCFNSTNTVPVSPPPVVIPTDDDIYNDSWITALVKLHNDARSKSGLKSLEVKAPLLTAARQHAKFMAEYKRLSHTGLGQSDPAQRITENGYFFRYMGENIAYGYSAPETVMVGWLSSPGHQANILNSAYTDVGFGIAKDSKGVLYWCAVFAFPAQEPAVENFIPPIFCPPGIFADVEEIERGLSK